MVKSELNPRQSKDPQNSLHSLILRFVSFLFLFFYFELHVW